MCIDCFVHIDILVYYSRSCTVVSYSVLVPLLYFVVHSVILCISDYIVNCFLSGLYFALFLT
ncbi:hypothetical protein M6B38_276735 [Iris pallida]|uniref:Uncharacterized protein n=1 Tax=Iris pallida TaxID=29817 RepID=A0AAX6G1V7_IRIPA|nr:hypothetical protein M6B38_388735 [Iris pallida]KAJ6847622.1 hypothetical protein M6B38_276735 [Iris pallida]